MLKCSPKKLWWNMSTRNWKNWKCTKIFQVCFTWLVISFGWISLAWGWSSTILTWWIYPAKPYHKSFTGWSWMIYNGSKMYSNGFWISCWILNSCLSFMGAPSTSTSCSKRMLQSTVFGPMVPPRFLHPISSWFPFDFLFFHSFFHSFSTF